MRALSGLALALLIAGFPVKAQGQEGDEAAVAQDTTGQDTLPPPPEPFRYVPPAFSLNVTLGTPGSGPLQTQPVLGRRQSILAPAQDSAVLDRSIQATGQLFAGASGTLSLSSAWALRFGVGYSRGRLETGYAGDEGYTAVAAELAGGTADLEIVSAESVLRYRIPSTRRLQPFVELGGAVSRWTVEGGPIDALALQSGVTRLQGLAGVGGVIPLNQRFSAEVRATTRLFRTPVHPRAAGDTLASVPKDDGAGLIIGRSTLLLTILDPTGTRFADSGRELVSLLRLELGISLDLGRPEAGPQGPVEPPDTTSPPGL